MTLDEMEAEILRVMGKQRPQANLTEDQKMVRLAEWHAQVNVPPREEFEPGDIIWHRCPEMAPIGGAGDPYLFVEYLPRKVQTWKHPNVELSNAAAARVLDCLATRIDSDGQTATFLVESRQFSRTRPVRKR